VSVKGQKTDLKKAEGVVFPGARISEKERPPPAGAWPLAKGRENVRDNKKNGGHLLAAEASKKNRKPKTGGTKKTKKKQKEKKKWWPDATCTKIWQETSEKKRRRGKVVGRGEGYFQTGRQTGSNPTGGSA